MLISVDLVYTCEIDLYLQGFVPVGEVNTKGRARKLPVRADVRRALCLPGGSTLMVSHLVKDLANSTEPLNHSSPPKLLTWSSPLAICEVQEPGGITKVLDPPNNSIPVTPGSSSHEAKTLISGILNLFLYLTHTRARARTFRHLHIGRSINPNCQNRTDDIF